MELVFWLVDWLVN